ncbi:MAG: helix-turn-helix domain-containing protein [bacterium]
MPEIVENVMTIKNVASYLKVNPATVYRMAQTGGIPGFKVRSEWRFRKDTLDSWIQAMEKGSEGSKKKTTSH